jgi:hypothetical protein
MRAADVDPIDDFLRALGRRLSGPARLRTDLLTEARGGLEDAAQAYREGGLDAETSRRLAVADFGAPGELAPAYQSELAAAQGRRLALLAVLLPVAMITADTMWWRAPSDTERPAAGFLLVTELADWASYAVGALALVVLVLLARRGPDPRRIVRLLGVATLLCVGLVWGMGTFAAGTTIVATPAALAWPPMWAALVCLNGGAGYLLVAGVRCLAAARLEVPAG